MVHGAGQGILIPDLWVENQTLNKALSLRDTDGVDPWAGAFLLPLNGKLKPPKVTGYTTVHHAAPGYEVFISFRVYNLIHILRGTRIN